VGARVTAMETLDALLARYEDTVPVAQPVDDDANLPLAQLDDGEEERSDAAGDSEDDSLEGDGAGSDEAALGTTDGAGEEVQTKGACPDPLKQKAEAAAKEEAGSRLGAVGRSISEDEGFFWHTVTPADTLFGLELRYGVCASQIRRINGMITDRLTSYLILKIPKSDRATGYVPTDTSDCQTARMMAVRLFRVRFPSISTQEIDFYLEDAKQDVTLALRNCAQEMEWQEQHMHKLKSRSITNTARRAKRGGVRGMFSWLSRGGKNGTRVEFASDSPLGNGTCKVSSPSCPAGLDGNSSRSPLLKHDFLQLSPPSTR